MPRSCNFEEVKVGDTIYWWEQPVKVLKVNRNTGVIYPIRVGMPTDVRNMPSITEDGRVYLSSAREFFWQPVKQPVAPLRPPRKVVKYLLLYRHIRCGSDWLITANGNGQMIFDSMQDLIAYQEKLSQNGWEYTSAEIWREEE